jgi:hypothetical protein
MREAKKSLKEKGIKSEDVKNLPPIEDTSNEGRGGTPHHVVAGLHLK